MDANSNQLAMEARQILLEADIRTLQGKVNSLEREKESAIRVFNSYKENIDKERLVHKQTLWDNAKLQNQILDLEWEIKELTSSNEALITELTKTSICLTATQKDLEDIQRLNFTSKLKLQSILIFR